eukprot:TRINITY_DN5103_c0_g1_i1.p1 TRINITY_DN5103_c0_g1~~TRINITY_DN5103_c0_g1_i1.p1  ORF type:complete len:267 (-),score=65.96 TRINITY_DN5103_c0_g1_i1:6-806(-)
MRHCVSQLEGFDDAEAELALKDSSESRLQEFYYVGLLLGKCMLDGILVPAHLGVTIRKRLLNIPIKYQDFELLDPEKMKTLSAMKDADYDNFEDIFDYVFAIEGPDGSVVEELVPGGADIQVTNENKKEFMKLQANWVLKSWAPQLDALRSGMNRVIPPEVLAPFNASELELLIVGVVDIDVDQWKEHTMYRTETAKNSPQVRWFWKVLHSMSSADRAKVLQFATGCSKLPIGGFKELTATRGTSCLLYTSPSPRDRTRYRMPSSA